jgi:hypothetical protein
MSIREAPKDLHAMQYAAWLCENTLATPAVKSNLEVIGQAIEAIAKSKFKDAKWKHPVYTAFLWLNRKVEHAQLARIKTDHLFFLNGDYNTVPEPKPPELPEFIPCKECSFGWKDVLKDGRKVGVASCECRKKWVVGTVAK